MSNFCLSRWEAKGTAVYHGGLVVALMSLNGRERHPGRAEANARLISASPELLAFAETILELYEDNSQQSLNVLTPEDIIVLRAIIAKAKKEP